MRRIENNAGDILGYVSATPGKLDAIAITPTESIVTGTRANAIKAIRQKADKQILS